MSLKVTFLGTGTSHGVPMIGCTCRVCQSSDPRDRRTRPSVLVEFESREPVSLLIDTSPDLRAQALAHGVTRVDGILYTHSHADHILGLDEVRRFNVLQRRAMPCYGDARTLADLRQTFSYIFGPPPAAGGGVPQISLFRVAGPFSIGGLEIVPVPLLHGPRPILGFRMGAFAYLTDCNAIPAESWPLIEGASCIVLDALRDKPHSTHFTVAEALDIAGRLRAERTYFTHMCHDLPHAETCARLPRGVELAYDGLTVEIA